MNRLEVNLLGETYEKMLFEIVSGQYKDVVFSLDDIQLSDNEPIINIQYTLESSLTDNNMNDFSKVIGDWIYNIIVEKYKEI